MNDIADQGTVARVRAHLDMLRKQDRGSYHVIARAAGVASMSIHAFMTGGAKGITRANAEAILAVQPRHLEKSRFTDPAGSMWRMRALVAMGHSSSQIARGTGLNPQSVKELLRGDLTYVSKENADRYRELYDAWWDRTPPGRTRYERAAAGQVMARAQREKWPTGMSLDDDELDQPGYEPTWQSRTWRPAAGRGVAPPVRDAYRDEDREAG